MTDTGRAALLPAMLAIDLRCPRCGQSLNAELPQAIDLADKPPWRAALVRNTAHDINCTSCQGVSRLNMAFVVWEPLQRRLLALHPGAEASESGNRFEQLAQTLRHGHPDRAAVAIEVCSSRGALLDALLVGCWDDAASLGLPFGPSWLPVLQRLPPAQRLLALTLADDGGAQAVLQAADSNPVFGAAVRRAFDPAAQIYTELIERALAAAATPDAHDADALIALALRGLVDGARHADANRGTSQRLHAAIAQAARRLPLDPATAWSAWPQRLPVELDGAARAIVLFNLAGAAFDRLTEPWPIAIAAALRLLFDAVLAAEPPADLAPLALERCGLLRLAVDADDARGDDALHEAARDFEALAKPIDAARLWRQLMQVHARRTGRHSHHSALPADADAQAEAALAAANALLVLLPQLPQKLALELGREVATVYWRMPGSGRSQRLQVAAQISRGLLTATDAVGTPQDRALERLQLANLLLDNGSDDATLVEEAISLLQAMPELDSDPDLEASRLSALAMAYKRRTSGKRADNLELSINTLRQLLQHQEARDTANARVQVDIARYNLGNALIRRVHGERADNLAEALALHEAVRQARQKARAHVQLRARSWLAIGNVHYEWALLSTPPDPTRLQDALKAYGQALRRLPAADVPADAALVLMQLGQAQSMMPFAGKGEKRRAAALDFFKRAADLAVQARDLPMQEDIAARHAGLLFADRSFADAALAYQQALAARRLLLAQAVSGLTREARLAAISPYAARLAYCLLQTGQIDKAIDALHSARALDLQAALQGVRSDSDAAQSYRQAWAAVKTLEDEERRRSASGPAGAALYRVQQELLAAREALGEAQAALEPTPADTAAVRGYARLAQQAGDDSLIVLPVVTSLGSVIVFAPPGRTSPHPDHDIVFLDDVTLNDVRELLGVSAPGWCQLIAALTSTRPGDPAGPMAHDMVGFFARLGRSPLLRALHERVLQTQARQVVIVPQGGLQSLPLPMALDRSTGRTLAQTASVRLQIGIEAAAVIEPPPQQRRRLLVFADALGDLPFARWEADLIAARAGTLLELQVVQGQRATRQALLERIENVDILHVAGHARYDASYPTRSALRCADGELSVQDLRQASRRAPLQLVVLSGCDSGLVDVSHLPEEFIGLPAAFHALGAQAVVSSMWSLPDEATAMLMAAFYRHLLDEKKLSPAAALAAAQHDMTTHTALALQVADQLQALYERGGRRDAVLARRALMHRRHPDDKPFAHPLYWGAFVCQVL